MKSADDDPNDQSRHSAATPDSSDSEMETAFSTFTTEAEMAVVKPVFESAGPTQQSGAKTVSDPLYESASLTGIGDVVGAVVNPVYECAGLTEQGGSESASNALYESTHSLTEVSCAQAATIQQYEPTTNEKKMRGEENYGASYDEDGDDVRF